MAKKDYSNLTKEQLLEVTSGQINYGLFLS